MEGVRYPVAVDHEPEALEGRDPGAEDHRCRERGPPLERERAQTEQASGQDPLGAGGGERGEAEPREQVTPAEQERDAGSQKQSPEAGLKTGHRPVGERTRGTQRDGCRE